MNHWKIDSSRTDAPQGFPHAITGPKNKLIAWVAENTDAQTIIKAEQRISGLASDSSRHRRLWLGSLASRGRH
jgi:hypothetical protein